MKFIARRWRRETAGRKKWWLTLVTFVFLATSGTDGGRYANARTLHWSADTSWPMTGHDAGASNFNAGERVLGLNTISHLHLAWSVPHAVYAIATDTRVFVITATGPPLAQNVSVLDARTGRRLRTFGRSVLGLSRTRIGPTGDIPEALAYANGRLIVGATTEVVAVDPSSGRLFWHVPGGALSLTVDGGTVYTDKMCRTPCGAPGTSAIDISSGHVLWRRNRGAGIPVLAGERLIQGSGAYQIWSRVLMPHNGVQFAVWPLAANWMGDTTSAYADFRVDEASLCRQWVERLRRSGSAVWQFDTGGDCDEPTALAYGNVFISSSRFVHAGGSDNGTIAALDAATGRSRWQTRIGQVAGLVVAGHLVFALHRRSPTSLIVMDAGSGRIVKRLQLLQYMAGATHPLLIAGGTVYVLDGLHVTALRP